MTAIAQDRTGLDLNEEGLEALQNVATGKSSEEVRNQFSNRIKKRVTYYFHGLNLCTIVYVRGKAVEIQNGLYDHPVTDKLVS